MITDRDAYLRLGEALTQKHSAERSAQLSVFKSALVNFAVEHGDEIRSNPEFTSKYTQICNLIGVDSLELLLYAELQQKRLKSFYEALAIRIVEVCHETRNFNGGLISLKELRSTLEADAEVRLGLSEEDLLLALQSLARFGRGYDVIVVGGKKWLKFYSASGEGGLSPDYRKIYEMCEFVGGYVSYRLLRDNYGWDAVRLKSVIDEMILEGLLWIDAGEREWLFWEPSWILS